MKACSFTRRVYDQHFVCTISLQFSFEEKTSPQFKLRVDANDKKIMQHINQIINHSMCNSCLIKRLSSKRMLGSLDFFPMEFMPLKTIAFC